MKDLINRIEEMAINNHNLNVYRDEAAAREIDYLKEIKELKELLKTMIWIAKDYERERDEWIEKDYERERDEWIEKYGELDAN